MSERKEWGQERQGQVVVQEEGSQTDGDEELNFKESEEWHKEEILLIMGYSRELWKRWFEKNETISAKPKNCELDK